MIDLIFTLGIIGALILVIGAAWPVGKKSNLKSTKNLLFLGGSFMMLIYAALNFYLLAGVFLFVLLQVLANVGALLGILNVDEDKKSALVGLVGMALIIWSLYIFNDSQGMYFIVGLTVLAIGFTRKEGATKQLLLTVGSALIAVFSFLVWNVIFLALNIAFALLSGYYFLKLKKD